MPSRGVTHHRQLIVWQRSMELLREVYAVQRRLPTYERFAMCDQMRRAAVSVPCNIAEGFGRAHQREYRHALAYSRGSLAEVETLLDACEMLEYVDPPSLATARSHVDEVRRMLTTMILRMRE